MTAATDTYGKEFKQECWDRHIAMVDQLKNAKSQPARLAIFKQIEEEKNIHVAREVWRYAFPKEDKKK